MPIDIYREIMTQPSIHSRSRIKKRLGNQYGHRTANPTKIS
ncbi:hypothetical protein ACQCT9_10810 [Sutcliffiella horikoshii]